MNPRKLLALLALIALGALPVSAQFNPSRAEEQEVQRLLALPDLTMRFQAAPLDDVLRTLCEASDMAYIGLPKPKDAANVDMTIKGNPYQALLLVAQTYGYVPIYENGLWHFSPMKEEKAKLFPKVYKMKYIHINEVNVNQQQLDKSVSRDTSSALPQPVNSTAFTSDISKVITDIKALLELDPSNLALNEKEATQQVNPAAMLLSGVPSAELATRLNMVPQTKDAALKGRIIADPDQNSLFIIATKEHHQWIETYLNTIDQPRKLVKLETRFLEVSDDPTSTYGLDWSKSLGGDGYKLGITSKDSVHSTSTAAETPTSGSATDNTKVGTYLFTSQLDHAILTGPELFSTLRAIQSDSKSRSLQHPTQVSVNNRQVVLRNVTQQPFQSGSSSTSGGGSSTNTNETEFIPIGTTVSLLPRILDGNDVELNIMINVSDMLGYQTIGASQVPITSSRDYTGQAIVASGNTLAIGGLDALHNTTGSTRVPLLGSIPVLGYMFRSDTNTDSKSNLIMFITATVLDGYSGGMKTSDALDETLKQLDADLEGRAKDTPKKGTGSKKYLFGK
jgi:type II secretory pathway component GspD/PulD (secretin)